ncbi:MAG TPA: hypothetical protein VN969_18655 [Streptosporangiaceae bacterium]|nr:hypothetical protein [Streptosporangiaceae bacterium]
MDASGVAIGVMCAVVLVCPTSHGDPWATNTIRWVFVGHGSP